MVLLIGCGRCAITGEDCANADKDTYVERPVEALYNAAMDDMVAERFDKAAKGFDEVERQHPYSIWATKAQLMSAYSLYEAGKYDESILALDRFILGAHSGGGMPSVRALSIPS